MGELIIYAEPATNYVLYLRRGVNRCYRENRVPEKTAELRAANPHLIVPGCIRYGSKLFVNYLFLIRLCAVADFDSNPVTRD